MTENLSKWDQRYISAEGTGEPCWVLANHKHLLPNTGTSLDLACGLGANALLLAELGLDSHGWDSSATALAKLTSFANEHQVTVHTLQRDVEAQPPEANSFDIIVISQFLYRPICNALVDALRPGGLLLYQTYHQHKLSSSGPSSPEYLLAANELLSLFSSLELVFYREDARHGDLQQGLRDLSYFIGRKPGP